MSGIKEKALELLNKIKLTIKRLDDSRQLIIQSSVMVTNATTGLSTIKSVIQRDYAQNVAKSLKNDVNSLKTRESIIRKTAGGALDAIKKALNAAGLGQPMGAIFLPIAAVAGLIAASSLLWNQTVNKTRDINARARALEALKAGEITSADFDAYVKKPPGAGAGGLFSNIKGMIFGAVALMVLPQLIKTGRRR